MLFLSRLLRQNPDKLIARFVRPHDPPIFAERFTMILRAFIYGYNIAVSSWRPAIALREELDNRFKPYDRGFAFEGAGMGYAAKWFATPGRERRFERSIHRLDMRYIYQYYVGLGWWLHTVYGYKAKKYARWIERLDYRYAPIVFDGVGFRAGLFHGDRHDHIARCFDGFLPQQQRICYQGFGRYAWFYGKFDWHNSLKQLDEVPKHYRSDALSGLGLAIAYSFIDQLQIALLCMNELPEDERVPFVQGLAFGLEARRLQNRWYWEEIEAQYVPSVRRSMDRWVAVVHESKDMASGQADFYTNWVDTTRTILQRELGQ